MIDYDIIVQKILDIDLSERITKTTITISCDIDYCQIVPKLIYNVLSDKDLWVLMNFLSGLWDDLITNPEFKNSVVKKLVLDDNLTNIVLRRIGILELVMFGVCKHKLLESEKSLALVEKFLLGTKTLISSNIDEFY